MSHTGKDQLRGWLQRRMAEVNRIAGQRASRLQQPAAGCGLSESGAEAVDLDTDIDVVTLDMTTYVAAAIERALERLAAGRYGVCDECGEQIPEVRLSALPFAARCIDCQRTLESSHRGNVGRL